MHNPKKKYFPSESNQSDGDEIKLKLALFYLTLKKNNKIFYSLMFYNNII